VSQSPRVVVTVAGQSNSEQTGFLSYEPAHLTGFLFPASGDSAGGTLVTFTGTNLGPVTSTLRLYFYRAGSLSEPEPPTMGCTVVVSSPAACVVPRLSACNHDSWCTRTYVGFARVRLCVVAVSHAQLRDVRNDPRRG
jgi:hypothetical protein